MSRWKAVDVTMADATQDEITVDTNMLGGGGGGEDDSTLVQAVQEVMGTLQIQEHANAQPGTGTGAGGADADYAWYPEAWAGLKRTASEYLPDVPVPQDVQAQIVAVFQTAPGSVPPWETEEAARVRVGTHVRNDFHQMGVPGAGGSWFREVIAQQGLLHLLAGPHEADLGELDRLPDELLTMVMGWMPVQTFLRFRQVNRRAHSLAGRSPPLRRVATYGFGGLRAVVAIGMGLTLTVGDLDRALARSDCVNCGGFGHFLFIPTVQRACFNCLRTHPDFRVEALSRFARSVRSSVARLRRLLGQFPLPVAGPYNDAEPHRRAAALLKSIVPVNWARAELYRLGALRSPPPGYEHPKEALCRRFMVSVTYPHYTSSTLNQRGTPHLADMPDHFAPLIQTYLPAQYGICCKGCTLKALCSSSTFVRAYMDVTYTVPGYLRHAAQCEWARGVWDISEGGTLDVGHHPFLLHAGHREPFLSYFGVHAGHGRNSATYLGI
ncbi:hypothetical protein GMORB2_3816 [Geosmithia morbida]|uniref:F-box domain-containing protein n=1 Tax=Geosmithia morbida TaxID=1094350 RepID=A0A9P4YYR2_9HYPO|nr:uncharacterized protein GMORB2_3816 [Geosmithia morbida]KAF4124977.1 hypothetical protein GMORB2_3816 [Geosmithia morbida]